MDACFRKAVAADLPQVWQVIVDAKQEMWRQGRRQWTEDYPSPAIIEADVRSGDAYVLCVGGGEVAAYAVISGKPEPAYATPCASWLTDGPYAVVHRLAVGAAFHGCGHGRRMLACAEDVARLMGVRSIKVDTNHDNAAMLHLLLTSGYVACGTVSYGPRGERMAFEKPVGAQP